MNTKHPAWLEYVLQLSRLRGYYTVYPGETTANTIIGVHTDIPELPEEYEDDKEARGDAVAASAKDEATDVFDQNWSVDVIHTLPQGGKLPYLTSLPIMAWNGKQINDEWFERQAKEYASQFRREVGHCTDDDKPMPADKLATDLFCSV